MTENPLTNPRGFGSDPEASPRSATAPLQELVADSAETWNNIAVAKRSDGATLYVGVIVGDPAIVDLLLGDLAVIALPECIRRVCVVLLANGCSELALGQVASAHRNDGLRITVVSERDQAMDSSRLAFAPYVARPQGRVGIAHARTMLQRYVGQLMGEDLGSYGWLLDEDMRLDERSAYCLGHLPAIRTQGIDALLCSVEGSSPNPPVFGLRGQLHDLYANLLWLNSLDPTDTLPDRSSENAMNRSRYPEYYYDLSRVHSDHLTVTFWIEPALADESVNEARSRLILGTRDLLSGRPLTRPLKSASEMAHPCSLRRSVNRGGNTFILNPLTLLQVPNMALNCQGLEMRRSDMVWAIINTHYRQRDIRQLDIPVLHVARYQQDTPLDVSKIAAEIVGAALYTALTDCISRGGVRHLLFTSDDLAIICSCFVRDTSRRLKALHDTCQYVNRILPRLRRAVLCTEYAEIDLAFQRMSDLSVYDAVMRLVSRVQDEDLCRFLVSFPEISEAFAHGSVSTIPLRSQLARAATHGGHQ